MSLYYGERRPRLGQASEELLEEMRKQKEELMREQAKPPIKIICGSYERGTEIQAKIHSCNGIDRFYFKTKILTPEHFKMMRTATQIKYHSGALMYAARPYTTDIGDIKLYFSHHESPMMRCQIKDLFTVPFSGQLQVRASILLIDKGVYYQQVSFNLIYDTPQIIGYYKDIEPEAKLSRIYLGDPVPIEFKDDEIDYYFCNKIKNNVNQDFLIKILDYKDDIYHVDIIDKRNNSLIKHLRDKFDYKIKEFEKIEQTNRLDEESRYHMDFIQHVLSVRGRNHVNPSDKYWKPKSTNKSNSNVPHNVSTKRYHGIVHYFKEKLRAIDNKDQSMSYLQKRFFKVKILCWCDPESFFVIPSDPEYVNNHATFKKELDTYQEKNDEENEGLDRTRHYVLGQKCLFKNEYNLNLGKWLRGVVITAPTLSENGFLIVNDGISEEQNLIGEDLQCLDNLVYRIRSIDYGFQCVRSSVNLRCVQNDQLFTKRGPWSLKCRLFGIDPLTHNVNAKGKREFSTSCLEMIDTWMRDRILDNGKFAFFHILFRSDIFKASDVWESDEPCAEISLFHRYEPPYKIADCILPRVRRSRFDCLNSYLVNRGFAGDYMHKLDTASRVDLDDYLVNLLVRHDRI